MDAIRDLERVEPWQESLERSLEQRDEVPRVSFVRYVLPPQRSLVSAKRRRLRWRVVADRVVLVVNAGSLFALALMMFLSPGGFGGRGAKAAARPDPGVVRASAKLNSADLPPAIPPVIPGSSRPAVTGMGSWRQMVRSSGYVNPLAHARVIPERIDQGVDYAGSGTLTALGAGRITYVAMSDTGWPGAFIEYRLLYGPYAGRYVYYAEGVTPAPGLRVGEKVRAGQVVASIIPGWYTGVEIGWGAGIGTTSYAANTPGWSASDGSVGVATTAGKKFSSLIAALGAPPGRVEG